MGVMWRERSNRHQRNGKKIFFNDLKIIIIIDKNEQYKEGVGHDSSTLWELNRSKSKNKINPDQ